MVFKKNMSALWVLKGHSCTVVSVLVQVAGTRDAAPEPAVLGFVPNQRHQSL